MQEECFRGKAIVERVVVVVHLDPFHSLIFIKLLKSRTKVIF